MLAMTPDIEAIIDRALTEDLSSGDPTTDSLVPPELTGRAVVVAKAEGILAGVDIALAVFRRVDPALATHVLIRDGEAVTIGDVICSAEGQVSSILRGERTALNFLQRMSGIATETGRYLSATQGLKTRIVDTRKTAPGLRVLDKYSVRMGGGRNHRQNLGDGILIKDNHIQALRQDGLSLTEIIQTARARASHTIKVEVEVEDMDQVTEALDAGAELLMLDNMNTEQMVEAARMARGRALTEASGNVTLESVRSVAETGVDIISVGALTHSAKALNISLDLV